MAKYKVWFTVKDDHGKIKEVEGGAIDVDLRLAELLQDEIDCIEEALPLEDYVLRPELNSYATDQEVESAVTEKDSIKYADFTFKD